VSAAPHFSIDEAAMPTHVTLPSEALCHYITDDELGRLGDMKKEPVMEIFLLTVGAFIGSLIPALQQLGKFRADPLTIDALGLLTIIIAAMMLGLAVVTGILWRQRFKTHKGMVDTIRNRPRVPVRLAHDNTA
jgi:hypothetical protein